MAAPIRRGRGGDDQADGRAWRGDDGSGAAGRMTSPLAIAVYAFLATLGAGLLGLRLQPHGEVEKDGSRDAVRLVQALVASIAALVLSLLIASASDHFRRQAAAVTTLASRVVVLDRLLGEYGPETAPLRASLRRASEQAVSDIWAGSDRRVAARSERNTFEQVMELVPTTPRQEFLHAQALRLGLEIAETHALLLASETMSAIQPAMLVVLIGWFALLFLATGLFTQHNPTVLGAMIAGAIAVAGAIFLVLELDHPFHGLVALSREPLLQAVHAMPRP